MVDTTGHRVNYEPGDPTVPEAPDNPPAFPTPINAIPGDTRGMSLRDYFAAAALQGLLAYSGEAAGQLDKADVAANSSYQYADAMLKRRAES